MQIHRADERGQSNLGWLTSRFSYSFADYYDPTRMGLGTLRVVNDDIISPGTGFGMHPHANMEIITIPLEGAVTHKDNMGNHGLISAGEVQVMSAGTGVVHSEYNASPNQDLSLFQIWILPHTQQVAPRYDHMSYNLEANRFTTLVSGHHEEHQLFIYQDATVSLGIFSQGQSQTILKHTHATFLMVQEGSISVKKQQLEKRDSLEIMPGESITITTTAQTTLLMITVPLLT